MDDNSSATLRSCDRQGIAFHAVFGFLIAHLLALLQVMYQNTPESPFETHAATVFLFIVAMLVYTLGLGVLLLQALDTKYDLILRHICCISGALACVLLLLVLAPLLGWFMFGFCSFLYVGLLLRTSYKQINDWFKSLCRVASRSSTEDQQGSGTGAGQVADSGDAGQMTQMAGSGV